MNECAHVEFSDELGSHYRLMLRFLLIITLTTVMGPSVASARDDCSSCHGQKGNPRFVDKKALDESVHSTVVCTKCHIDVSEYPHGKVSRVNCGICHFLGRDGAPREEAQKYKLSVHGKALAAGNTSAATCQACHGSHAIYPRNDTRSATRKQNIPVLCSKCHPGESDMYSKSIHGRELLERSNAKAPTCFDCHLEHLIPPTEDQQWKLSLIKQCGTCHQEQINTYRKTYHGKVTRLGYTTMAKCTDCHGSHTIEQVTEKTSMLSEQNILGTCKKCHPRATIGFTKFYAHAEESNRAKYPVMFYTYAFMTLLLIGVFTFFLTHTFLWAYRALKERMDKKGGE
jgi:DNA-directed RNA polymerase subunit M/transcription elongation factor TFIIS